MSRSQCKCCYYDGHAPPCCPGWFHAEDSCGNGPGIECCDVCGTFPDDDAAYEAHAKACDCGLIVAVSPEKGIHPGFLWHWTVDGEPLCTVDVSLLDYLRADQGSFICGCATREQAERTVRRARDVLPKTVELTVVEGGCPEYDVAFFDYAE